MSPQESIAHYRITSKLGEGGMGAVYRATDTKLNRDVAIKVLPPAFAEDTARMQRFEREAQVLASLNHPNIAAIYGIEQSAIVMELVEGDDLKGPVPVDTAIAYARQIALALEAAHEKGIIHRDLKPANIKVTPDGMVKLLDFGLAKAAEERAASTAASPTLSPTLSLAMTQAGMILGTAAYMSPEQARGKPVDKRADIWAFGVVLFEMLTGRHLYGGGETVTDTLAAVVLAEPDYTALPANTPPRIRKLIERCLRKDPKLRLRDIGEARILLDEPEPAATAPAALPAVRHQPRWWIAAAAALALALAALSVIHFRESPPRTAAVRFQVLPPEGSAFNQPFLTLSPDGRKLAFTANAKAGGPAVLWVRALDSLEARALPGTEGVLFPFWSPDSRFLAFTANARLKKVEASGGPPQTLCNLPASGLAAGGYWDHDGTVFFGAAEGIFRVPKGGGEAVQVTRTDSAHGELGHYYPHILPDGRYLCLILSATRENSAIYLGSRDGKEKKRLVGTSFGFSYAPPSENGKPGYVLFLREFTFMAQPLDPRTFAPAGDAFPVAERVGTVRSYALFTVSPGGVLAYRPAASPDSRQLTWFDRGGKSLGTLGAPGEYNNVTLSRDGARAAVTQVEPQALNPDVWLIDVARAIPTRFTFDEAEEADPVWSPDGSRVAFTSNREGPFALYAKESSGAAKEERLQKAELDERPCDWSPDGQFLMFTQGVRSTGGLWLLSDPAGDPAKRKVTPYLETSFGMTQCQFSPGPAGAPRWVAYTSRESKQGYEVYVQSFPAGGGKFQVSKGGATQPRWRRDGKEIFYIAPDGKLMAVDVKTAPRFEAGIPHALFDSHIFVAPRVFRYDVTADGQRFLVITSKQSDAAAAPEAVTVVLNWTAGLKQ